MATYASDSSGPDDNDYAETNVLLGYASKDPCDDTISHLGGLPTWLDPAIPPSAALAKCKVCKDLMVLLLQLNADLPEVFPGHERRLYVLTCRGKACRRKDGSVRALRGARITETPAKNKRKDHNNAELIATSPYDQAEAVISTNIGESLFCAKPTTTLSYSNPFSTSTSSSIQSCLFASPPSKPTMQPAQDPPNLHDLPITFTSALSLNNKAPCAPPLPHEPWPQESDFPPQYPLYYLVDADYETLDKLSNDKPLPQPTMNLEDEGSSNGQKEDKDTYESTIDEVFQKFADRLAQNPEQVIRYEFKGQPLLYSKTDAVGKLLAPTLAQSSNVSLKPRSYENRIPKCGNCGAGRVFEVQLTPHAITELEAGEMSLEGMDWGTIIVGVCEKDCLPYETEGGKVGYVEEWAGVQWEELGEKR